MKNRVQQYLVVYSAVVTAVFCISVWHGTTARAAQNAQQQGTRDWKHADFDQLTVHRINIVEPDGTPRWILSDRAEFPGTFTHGKETARPDRSDSAGALMMNDEGTENGGLIFGGYEEKNGKRHSFGHLSFDEYETDQALALGMTQSGDTHVSAIRITDQPNEILTAQQIAEIGRIHAMPDSPAKRDAMHKFFSVHPIEKPRAELSRGTNGDAELDLCDGEGHDRMVLKVTRDGSSSIQILDNAGKTVKQWP